MMATNVTPRSLSINKIYCNLLLPEDFQSSTLKVEAIQDSNSMLLVHVVPKQRQESFQPRKLQHHNNLLGMRRKRIIQVTRLVIPIYTILKHTFFLFPTFCSYLSTTSSLKLISGQSCWYQTGYEKNTVADPNENSSDLNMKILQTLI